MLDSQKRARVRHADLWTVGLGGTAGIFAAVLQMAAEPLRALMVLAGLAVGLLSLVSPHTGLYLLAAASIVSWPYDAIKPLGLAVAASALLWAASFRRRLVPRDSLFLMLGLLAGFICLSALRMDSPEARSKALSYVTYLVYYWAVYTLATEKVTVRLVGSMLSSGVLIAIIGWVQYWHPFIWPASAIAVQEQTAVYGTGAAVAALVSTNEFRVESLTGTPDYLGLAMQILLPFAFFWTIRQKSRIRIVCGMGMLLLMSSALVLSQTRGVLLSVLLIVVPFLAARVGWRRSLPLFFWSSVLAAGLMIGYGPLRERMLSFVTGSGVAANDMAMSWRLQMLPIAGQMFLDHFWLGVGLGQQATLWRVYAPWDVFIFTQTNPLHSAYLSLAIDVGVFGLVLLLSLVGLAWWHLHRLQGQFRRDGPSRLLDLTYAAEAAWVALAVNLTLYPALDTFRYFWVLLGLIGALIRVGSDLSSVPASREPAHA